MGYLSKISQNHQQQRGIETLGTPLTGAELVSVLGLGGPSDSGVTVTPTNSVTLPAFYSGVNIISQDMAKLPLHVFEKLAGGGRRIASEHPLDILLSAAPNQEMTAFTMRQFIWSSVLIRGNAFIQIVRNNAGKIMELWPLMPDRMSVWRSLSSSPDGFAGALVYWYSPFGQAARILDPGEVLHIRGLTQEGLIGLSIVHTHMRAIGAGIAADTFAARLWANSAVPGLALMYPGVLSEQAKANLQNSFLSRHLGPQNSNKTAILEDGIKIEKISMSNEESQFLESRDYSVRDIARILRLQPYKLAEMSATTNNNIAQSALEHVTDTLQPWAVNFEQAVNQKMLFNNPKFFVEHDFSSLLRGDPAARVQYYKGMRDMGAINADTIRDNEGLNPIGGPAGQTYLRPLNYIDANTEPEETPPSPPGGSQPGEGNPDGLPPVAPKTPAEPAKASIRSSSDKPKPQVGRMRLRAAYKTLLKAAAVKLAKREKIDLVRIVGTRARHRDTGSAITAAVAAYYASDKTQKYITNQLAPIFSSMAGAIHEQESDAIGTPINADILPVFVDKYTSNAVDSYVTEQTDFVNSVIDNHADGSETSLADDVSQSFDDRMATGPDGFASDQAVGLDNSTAALTDSVGGVSEWTWVQTKAGCSACADIASGNGIMPPKGSPYTGPVEPAMMPPLHKLCDCQLQAAKIDPLHGDN